MPDFAQIVTDVEANPESVSGVARALAEALPAAQGREAWAAGKHVNQFLEASTRILLGWVAGGRDDEAQRLVAALQDVLARAGTDPWERMVPAERLTLGLRHLLFVAETYLKTDNLALPMGKLQGQRRRAWRLALHLADGAGGLITVRNAVDGGVFAQRNTADHALNELAKLGLLERQEQDQAVAFRLTFAGRHVCRELRRMRIDPEAAVERVRSGAEHEHVGTPAGAAGRAARAGAQRKRQGQRAIAQAVLDAGLDATRPFRRTVAMGS